MRENGIPPRVELIYDRDCPHVVLAREALRAGFAEAGLAPSWTEWERGAPQSPARVRGYGSPTVLVDGSDVAGESPGTGAASCRLYLDARGGLRGAPTGRRSLRP